MSDDNSNDVVMVESNETSGKGTSKEVESRPLMQLFQRLISNDNNENTVLTNAQIISILDKEYGIDISKLHDLEVDIYLNIVKRFLKDWPKWDDFDRGINWLRKNKAQASIKRTLEHKYKDLKTYLQVHIDATKPLAKETVRQMLEDYAKNMDLVDTSDIILEIYCSRKHLNDLICNRPTSIYNNIFNIANHQLNTIRCSKLPIESILNWWGVQITVEMRSLLISRTTMHQLKHVLVNKKNGPRNLKRVLNQNIQIKEHKHKRPTDEISLETINDVFDIILTQYDCQNDVANSVLASLFTMLKTDLEATNGKKKVIKVPGTYRQHSNKYPYYRKLCKEVDPELPSNGNHYDLYIEETIAPMHVFHIGKFGKPNFNSTPKDEVTITVECGECKSKYTGIDVCMLMRDHFDVYHAKEPDWTCTNCEETFSMSDLSQNKWFHNC